MLLAATTVFIHSDSYIHPSNSFPPPSPSPEQGPMWITAYYTVWGVCDLPPNRIDWSAVTHVIHQQLVPSTTGRFWKFPRAFKNDDTSYFERGIGAGCGDLNVQAELIRLAHEHGRSVLLGLGGAGEGEKAFRFITSDEEKLRSYVGSVLEYARRRGYDGVDLDWEYVYRRDRKPFVELLQALRDSLDTWNPRGILTIAIPGWYSWKYGYDIGRMNTLVDQVNLMTYDMATSWNRYTGFNAPLYKPRYRPYDGLDVHSGVTDWISHGLNPSKIGLGLPLYGYLWWGNSAPGQRKSLDTVIQIGYDEVVRRSRSALKVTDSESQVSWISGVEPHGRRYFISFDDSTSLIRKIWYAQDRRLGGIMVFELWRGVIRETSDQPLMRVIRDAAFKPSAADFGIPVPISPPDRSIATGSLVRLEWEGRSPGLTYRVQLSRDSSFHLPVIVDTLTPQLSITLPSLPLEEYFYWRVRQEIDGQIGPWSPIKGFTHRKRHSSPGSD